MIHDYTFQTASTLAGVLKKQGYYLKPAAEGPVSDLYRLGNYAIGTKRPSGIQLSLEEAVHLGSTYKNQKGDLVHDLGMEEYVKILSQSLETELEVAQTEANPMIAEITDAVEAEVQTEISSASQEFAVVPVAYAGIWNSPMLNDLTMRYQETPYEEVVLNLILPEPISQACSWLDLMRTGSELFDHELAEFVSQQGEGYVAKAYQVVFGKSVESLNLSGLIHIAPTAAGVDNANRALVIHLITRHLMEHPPAELNVPLTDYRLYMSKILSQSGRAVQQALTNRATAISRRQLVYQYPAKAVEQTGETLKVLVNADVYEEWLRDGGEPDVLLGAAVSDQERGYQKLLEQRDFYLKQWIATLRTFTMTQESYRNRYCKQAIERIFSQRINQHTPVKGRPFNREVAHRHVRTFLQRQTGAIHDKLWGINRTLVADVFFPMYSTEELLTRIDQESASHESYTIREAAFSAVASLLTDWIADNIVVSKITPAEG